MRRFLILSALSAALLWANNTSVFVFQGPGAAPKLLAHRGVHQRFAGGVPDTDTCTAQPVKPVTHGFIENTLPSMAHAFAAGATVVELDVHLTPDGVFAVFHDWRVDCRTNGTGQTNKLPFAALRALDIGHGYSPDGVTFPLRGTGLGLMPRLEQVFAAFPRGRFLINFKSDKRSEGRALVKLLEANPEWAPQVWAVYGGRQPSQEVAESLDIPAFDKGSVRACLIRYAALGWSGWVPKVCQKTVVMIPQNVAPWLWGWPARFGQRMERAGTQVILVGPLAGSGHVRGIDETGHLARVPQGFAGYIWTNAVEDIGPEFSARFTPSDAQ